MKFKLNKKSIILISILFVALLSLNTKVNAKERILRTYYANQGTTITIQSGDHPADWKYNNCLYSAAKTSSGLKNHGWKYNGKTGSVTIPNDSNKAKMKTMYYVLTYKGVSNDWAQIKIIPKYSLKVGSSTINVGKTTNASVYYEGSSINLSKLSEPWNKTTDSHYYTASYKFTSSNNSVATVDNNGKITGKGVGSATITMTRSFKDVHKVDGKSHTANSSVKATINITVNKAGTTSSTTTTSSNTSKTTKSSTNITLNFNANGGSGAPGNKTITLKKSFTMPTTKPTKANCTFLGWSTSKDYVPNSSAYSGDILYKPGNTYTIQDSRGSSLTLYAVWQWSLLPTTQINAKVANFQAPTYLKADTNAYCIKFKSSLDSNIYANKGYKSGAVALYQIQKIRGGTANKSYLTPNSNKEKTYFVTGSGTNFRKINYYYHTDLSYGTFLATIYREVMSGYPVAVKVHNSANQEIYVIAYAINASANVKKGIIKASDIYVIDTTNLHWNKLSDFRYALNSNKKYSLGIYENHSLSYEIIPVSSINLNKTSIILPLGGSTKLTATPNPNNASDKKLTWASSNTKAVTVSEGTVKAVAAGTSTVTVTSKQNSSAKKSCSVTVVDTNGMVNYAKSFKGKTLQECKDMFDKQKVKYEPYSSEWCSWFVYTMYKRYGVINYNWTYGKNAYGSGFSWADNWRGLGDGRFHKRDGYTPKPGDIIIYDWDYDGGSDHVGMVIKVANNKVYTIEGNQEKNDNVETNYTERIVKEKERDLKWSCIIGYYSICNY